MEKTTIALAFVLLSTSTTFAQTHLPLPNQAYNPVPQVNPYPVPYQSWQVPLSQPQVNPYDYQRNILSPPGSYTNPYHSRDNYPRRNQTGTGYRR